MVRQNGWLLVTSYVRCSNGQKHQGMYKGKQTVSQTVERPEGISNEASAPAVRLALYG